MNIKEISVFDEEKKLFQEQFTTQMDAMMKSYRDILENLKVNDFGNDHENDEESPGIDINIYSKEKNSCIQLKSSMNCFLLSAKQLLGLIEQIKLYVIKNSELLEIASEKTVSENLKQMNEEIEKILRMEGQNVM